MSNLDDIFSRIRSLAKANDKVKNGEEVINYIKSNYHAIQEEACRVRSPKRRTYGRCERKLVDDFVFICDYRCDAQNRTAVNYIMSSLKFPGYEEDKPRFRQRMENLMKKLRNTNKSVRPSNRNCSVSKHNSNNLTQSDSPVNNLDESEPKSSLETISYPSPSLEHLSNDDIFQGLFFIPTYDETEKTADDEFFVFPDEVNTWQKAGVINMESNGDCRKLVQIIQQNKDAKQVIPSPESSFNDHSEIVSTLFLDVNVLGL